jgi:hypothetical protein
MEITCELKVILIPVRYVGWDADSLDKRIYQLGVPLLEIFRNGILLLGILGMME